MLIDKSITPFLFGHLFSHFIGLCYHKNSLMYEIILKLKNQTINSIQAVGKQKANSLKEDVIDSSILHP